VSNNLRHHDRLTVIVEFVLPGDFAGDGKKSDTVGYFAGAGSGTPAPLFGCVEQTFLSAGGGTFQFRFGRLESRPNPQAGKPALLFLLRF
jgi:hypothetical protein